jgi:ubiquinone/menaquinone biosynthesis C-methylase UbiE
MMLDLTAIDASDQSFDVVLASHVLEHIPEDEQAMREIRRVLAPGGWAFLVVPFDPDREVSYEDPLITSREGRKAAFGQEDHVRWYAGPDFEKRLERAGFSVERVEVTSPTERARFKLGGNGAADWAVLCR